MNSTNTTTKFTAIGRLMRVCGLIVDMKYTPVSSDAEISSIPGGMKKYLGFESQLVQRTSYTLEDWENLIYTELKEGRPVIFSGTTTGGSGHCFVCDGYRASDNTFHFNFGFEGKGDGYFDISAINPSVSSTGGINSDQSGFNSDVRAVIGIKKDENATIETDYRLSAYALSPYDDEYARSATPSVYRRFLNDLTETVTYYSGIGLEVDGEVKMLYQASSGATQSWNAMKERYGNAGLDFSDIPNGEYRIYAYSKTTTGNWMRMRGSDLHYIDVKLTADKIIFNPSADLVVNYIKKGTESNEIIVNITNQGSAENTTPFQIVIDGTIYAKAIPAVKPGETVDVVFYTTTTLTASQVAEAKMQNLASTPSDSYNMFNAASLNLPYWKVDGRKKISNATIVPASAFAVDFANASNISTLDVSTIGNVTAANALFFVDDNTSSTITSALSGKNVVKNGVIESLDLQDADFVVPTEFTATEVTYSRTFGNGLTRPASSTAYTNGWESVVLPFEATAVEVSGTTKQWFTSKTDNQGDFWVFKFNGDDGEKISTDYHNDNVLAANTPYIVAVPDESWGAQYSLKGQTLTFKAENATLSPTAQPVQELSSMTVNGTYRTVEQSDVYVLNAAGDSFVLLEDAADVAPFTVYVSGGNTAGARVLGFVVDENGLTGISNAFAGRADGRADSLAAKGTFDLEGRRMADDVQLKPGLYIQNGRKVVIR